MKIKKTVKYDSEIVSYKTPLLCANLLEEYKLVNSLSESKSKTKSWKRDACVSVACADLSFKI